MKTKVIAFRVTETEHEALFKMAVLCGENLSEFVGRHLTDLKAVALNNLKMQQKKAEAKAKREAKKAVDNVSE